MSNILYIIFFTNIQNPLVNIPPARHSTKILFKVLQCNMRIYSENDQQKVRKLISKPRLEGMLFGFPQLIGFQQVVFDRRLGCCLSRKGFVCVSVMCGTVYKRDCYVSICFRWLSIYLLPPPDTYVIYYTISSNQFLLISDS